MVSRTGYYIIGICFCCFLFSCSNLKYLPAGESLYTGATVKVRGKKISHKERKALQTELEEMVRPRPNRKVLGMRLRLTAYNLAGTKERKEGSPGYWLRNKFGEPPVLLSEVDVDHNILVMENHLENEGFFNADAKGRVRAKKRKASAFYRVRPGLPYAIKEVTFSIDSSTTIGRAILATQQYTLLKKKQRFDLDVIKAERERIDNVLKEQGYYFFNPDYLIVNADTTIGDHLVNMYVKLKPQTPRQAKTPYKINDVYIYSNYTLSTASADTNRNDAINYEGYYVVDKEKKYKPYLFEQSMQFNPGDWYNRTDHNLTINRLINLGLFKFVKNRFEVARNVDSPALNAYYYLTPYLKKSLQVEVNASTKSNNLTGSRLTVGWKNRNTFHAGELLAIDAYGGFEVQYSGQSQGYNMYQTGVDASLTFPRFLIPFFTINTKGGYIPKTKVEIGYELLNRRKLYTLNSFKASYGYAWKESLKKEHEFNPVSINYVQPMNVTQEYRDSANNNAILQKAIEKQFILGSNYNYTYNGLVTDQPRNGIYFNGNVDLSGNVAGLVTGGNVKAGDTAYIFNAQFAQYLRLEGDFRFYRRISSSMVWANRIIAGFGYPYGNSSELPYVKQFFSGGNNSIRAFRSRSVGPGTYHTDSISTFLPDQSGDIKLEFNTELRKKLFSIVHGAIFVDAGNVWLYNDNPDKPGAKFSKDFLNQLAVGAGVGLRFDVSFLVLRLDVAFPLRKPYLPEGQRWVIDQIDFSKQWFQDNLIYNIGIGYPF